MVLIVTAISTSMARTDCGWRFTSDFEVLRHKRVMARAPSRNAN
jgi:hypothetical protein